MSHPALEPIAGEFLHSIRDELKHVGSDAHRDANNQAVQMSIAASLKRIADKLGSIDSAGFENQLLDIAYKAGLNFRGQA